MSNPGVTRRRNRACHSAAAAALLVLLVALPNPAHADWRFDWRFTAAELQGGAIFWDENPGVTSMNFLRYEMGSRRLLIGTEAFGLRFQMEKKNENQLVEAGVGIWETLPLTATYVVYDWQEDYGITRGFRYLCAYARINALLARTFDTGQQVRYGEGGLNLYWNGPHHAPVVSLAVRAGYRLQHLGRNVQDGETRESELEHQLLLGVTVSLDFWSSSYAKRNTWRKQTAKREREWQHY